MLLAVPREAVIGRDVGEVIATPALTPRAGAEASGPREARVSRPSSRTSAVRDGPRARTLPRSGALPKRQDA
jgi:hypothetical protein